jgi:hypothetical protein
LMMLILSFSPKFANGSIRSLFTLSSSAIAWLPQIASGMFSLSSLSLAAFQLALSLPPLTKLSCTFDTATAKLDITSLRHVLSRLLPIPEWSIITTHTISRESPHQLVRTFSQLLFTLYLYQNFIIFRNGRFLLSKHRRMVHSKTLPFPSPNIVIHNI